MGFDAFLKITSPDVKGESKDDAHKDWIEVLSFSHGISQPTSSTRSSSGGAGSGRANVQAAQATVATSELDLSYTKIYAPTDGIIGKTEVNAGNLVGRGQSTLLTQISKVDPIRLRVSISEREYLEIARRRGWLERYPRYIGALNWISLPATIIAVVGIVIEIVAPLAVARLVDADRSASQCSRLRHDRSPRLHGRDRLPRR